MTKPSHIEHWHTDRHGPLSEAALRGGLESHGDRVARHVCPPGTVLPDHSHAGERIGAVLSGRCRRVRGGAAGVPGPEPVVCVDAVRAAPGLTGTYRLVCTGLMRPARKPAPAKQPDVTRDAIVDAAYQEIYRHGFQAASLNNILAKTRLTKGALYHHFPTKNDLAYAVIDEVIREGLEVRIFAPLRESADPVEALLDVIRNKADGVTADTVKLGCPLNNLMQEMSPLDSEFKGRLNAILKTWQDTVREALQRAQKQGRVRKDVDCRAAALFIVSAYEGCIGIAKNLQSVKEFRLCMVQLEHYVLGLLSAGR